MNKASVIISIYNNLHFLKLVLAGFENQSDKDFEIILADDGSGKDVIDEIKLLLSKFPVKIKHIWQEDAGFRKNKILNKAIGIAETDYLVFIDGDCIPHSKFIVGHLSNRERKYCLAGRRVNLSKKISDKLNYELVKDGFPEKKYFKLITDGLFGRSTYVEKGFYSENKFLLGLLHKKNRGLLGCNFSIYKDELLAVNGFDERYEGPSIGEDTDLQFRLELSGIKLKSITHSAVQYHLFHTYQERPPENLDLFYRLKKEKQAFTPFGIIKKS